MGPARGTAAGTAAVTAAVTEDSDVCPGVEGREPAQPSADDATSDDELDALQDLGDEIATLAAHMHAAEYRFLTLIAEFDRLRGWEPGGHRSCAHWLAFRTGIDRGAARERVRAARALVDLPRISASMAQGELSFAKVRALTRLATPESEADLLELAQCSTAAQLERTVRAWRRLSRWDEAELERMRHRSRCFSVFPDEDGMYLVRGRLDPEVGAMLMRAVEAASDALFRRDISERTSERTSKDPSDEIEPKQRRADAVGLLAERALAVGFGSTGEDAESADVSGSRAERYQVVLHVEGATLRSADQSKGQSAGQSAGEPGRSELEDGTRVSAETSRRLACDASVVRLTEAPDGSVLDVGRKTRTIPPALRRALESRDRGCRFPGCGLRFTDAHHLRHWADGGETKLDNLVLLCRFHHRLVHEEGYSVHFQPDRRPGSGDRPPSDVGQRPDTLGQRQSAVDPQPDSPARRLYFLDPSMRLLPDVPPPPPRLPDEPVEELMQQNKARGVEPDFHTAADRYKREVDIPSSVFMRALEALDGAA